MWACWGMVLSMQLSTSAIMTTSKMIVLTTLIAERLSARLLIMQRSQFAFVFMYVYSSHFNCVGAVSVVSSGVPRLLATWYWFDQEAIKDHAHARAVMEQGLYYTVLVRPGGDRRVIKRSCESRNGARAVQA